LGLYASRPMHVTRVFLLRVLMEFCLWEIKLQVATCLIRQLNAFDNETVAIASSLSAAAAAAGAVVVNV